VFELALQPVEEVEAKIDDPEIGAGERAGQFLA
jgi:hypothetical protein